MRLSAECKRQLEEAESRVEILMKRVRRWSPFRSIPKSPRNDQSGPNRLCRTISPNRSRASIVCSTNGCRMRASNRFPFISAMRYSLFAGGKRIRPILAIAAARAVSDSPDGIENAAATLELIHTYSLIHDDLPALDNDDLRRGRPTCHKVFGEAMAILAGDALLTLAFEVLSRLRHIDAERKIRLVEELSRAAGTVGGMIGGQVNDIEGERKNRRRFCSNRFIGPRPARCCGRAFAWARFMRARPSDELAALSQYGEHVGLAFQIIDDVLDVEESSEALGKTAGKDQAQQKITFPAVYGLGAVARNGGRGALGGAHALCGSSTIARTACGRSPTSSFSARLEQHGFAGTRRTAAGCGAGGTAAWWNRARRRKR